MKTAIPLSIILVAGQAICVSAQAAEQTLRCVSQVGKTTTVVTVNYHTPGFNGALSGAYHFSEKYSGSFPTDTEIGGAASGSLSNSAQGINADFGFIAFDTPTDLAVQNSFGTLTIGHGDSATVRRGLNCELK